MNKLDVFLIIACSIISAVTISLGYRFAKTRRRVGTLTSSAKSDYRDEAETPGKTEISVIIPARNEVRDIAATVHSLLEQQGVSVQIVVVDDDSTDGTGELLDKLAVASPRLRVLHAMPMRPGWFGKANAMQNGIELLEECELVLFTDADIRFEPNCLVTALNEFWRKELDFLSLLPRFDATTFWENVYMPHSFVAGCVRFLPPSVNEQHRPEGAAAGAFMLARRAALRDIGPSRR